MISVKAQQPFGRRSEKVIVGLSDSHLSHDFNS